MPDDFVTVYLIETGAPALMHSIDAAEAVRIGDYSYAPPEGKEPDEAVMAHARAQAAGIGTTTHPELQTPEEREESRRRATDAAAAALAQARVVVVEPSAVVPEPVATRSARHAPSVPEEKK